jgi:hypothetical protein
VGLWGMCGSPTTKAEGRMFKVISTEQAKIMSLIFSSTKKKKIVEAISACTESTYFISLQKIFIS